MKTLRLNVEGSWRSPSADQNIRKAAEILRNGGLVAFPTETVYGLGANAENRDAVLKIFEAKQRPTWDPIIVHASSLEMLRTLVREWPDKAQLLAEKFMPGPITLLLPKASVIPDECTAGREKVGVRIPWHPIALELIRQAQIPIAAPSANRFGGTSPTTADHVLHDLDGRIDAVLDGGPCTVGVESTVIDPTLDVPVIYRPGGVTRQQIEAVIGSVVVAERNITTDVPPESLESPGLGIRHYAPRAKVILVEGEEGMLAAAREELVAGRKVGVMHPEGWRSVEGTVLYDWGTWERREMLASRLYFGLRWLDMQNVNVIVCPVPPAEGMGLAIRDRLAKAAK